MINPVGKNRNDMIDQSPKKSFPLAHIVEVCGGRFVGPADDAQKPILGVGTLTEATPDEVSWLLEEKHVRALSACKAAAVIGPQKLIADSPRAILVDDPSMAIARILALFQIPLTAPVAGIHPSAVVDATANLGENVAVGACAVIGPSSRIGANTIIHPGVSIGAGVTIGSNCRIFDRCVIYDRCTLGDRVFIHGGTVIGADGFGYVFRKGAHQKIAHIGSVIIEDDVEIGANCCVDRAKIGATVIGRGSKIDNLVQVAHNVRIGPLCVLAGQAGLAGSCRLGTGVVMGGQSAVVDGVTIGDGVTIAGKSVATKNIEPGKSIVGFPGIDSKEAFRLDARVRKLPKLQQEVAELAKRVAQLEAATHHPERG